MGRNDPCFCGSNMKKKKCHPEINSKSRAARLLKVFNEIDIKLKNHYEDKDNKPLCKAGCSECCYHYFTVSDVEYDLIAREVNKWDEKEKIKIRNKSIENAQKFKEMHPDVFKFFEDDQSGNKDMLVEELKNFDKSSDFRMPCVFLDDNSQKCKIYNVRPLICRKHGVSYYYNDQRDYYICEKVGSTSKAKSWLADFTFMKDNNKYRFDTIVIDEIEQVIRPKQYPLFYLIYYNTYKNKNGFKPVNAKYNFRTPENIFINQFKNGLKNINS